jgi:hypothetical protein
MKRWRKMTWALARLQRWEQLMKRTIQCFRAAVLAMGLLAIVALAGCGSGGTTTSNASNGGTSQTARPEPSVELHLNQGSFSQTGSSATLTGTVTPGASVTVNEHSAVVHGQRWRRTLHLDIGENNVSVKASLAGHQSAEDTITVTRHHTHAELEAIAQARKEREARRKEREEREHQARREREERQEREEQAKKEIENATTSQQNALKEAESYLQSSAFSEAGLIEQLSSEAGSKFPHADAVWAVEHLHVNWNEQAVKEAKDYLSSSSFSCQGLIDQLSSDAGSKFTVEQAEYAAKKVGLC